MSVLGRNDLYFGLGQHAEAGVSFNKAIALNLKSHNSKTTQKIVNEQDMGKDFIMRNIHFAEIQF